MNITRTMCSSQTGHSMRISRHQQAIDLDTINKSAMWVTWSLRLPWDSLTSTLSENFSVTIMLVPQKWIMLLWAFRRLISIIVRWRGSKLLKDLESQSISRIKVERLNSKGHKKGRSMRGQTCHLVMVTGLLRQPHHPRCRGFRIILRMELWK